MGGAASVQMALSGPVTPLTRWGPRHKKRTKNVLELPDEVLHQIVARLTDPKDLCCLQRCSKRLCSLVEVGLVFARARPVSPSSFPGTLLYKKRWAI